MTQSDYDKVAGDLLALARDIETSKRPGYTLGAEDVLTNFKQVAKRAGVTTEQAWAVYFLKHIDAITSIMTRPDLPVAEAAAGRFADAVNYLRLGWAILHERESVKRPAPPAGKHVTVNAVTEAAEFTHQTGPVMATLELTQERADEIKREHERFLRETNKPVFEKVGEYGQVQLKR